MTTKTAALEAHIDDLRQKHSESIAMDQIRTVQRTIELLQVASAMLVSAVSATDETYKAMSGVRKAIEQLELKRDSEIVERIADDRVRRYLRDSLNVRS